MAHHHDDLDTEPSGETSGGGLSGKVPDFVRKALMTGIGAVFMTEEGVRNALGDNIKLPKEAMSYIMGQADRTKRELIHTLARELRTFLDGLEVEDLVQKSLAGATFEINTTIRVIPADEGGVKLAVADKKMRRVKDEYDDDDDHDEAAKPKRKRSTKKKTATKSKAKRTTKKAATKSKSTSKA